KRPFPMRAGPAAMRQKSKSHSRRLAGGSKGAARTARAHLLLPGVAMRLFLTSSALLVSAALALSAGLPLTAKEVSLMLRSGYSSETIMRELAARHFGDAVDSAVEKQLEKAGASPALLNALRNGSFRASPDEIAAAEEKLAAQEESVEEAQQQPRAQPKPSPGAPNQ